MSARRSERIRFVFGPLLPVLPLLVFKSHQVARVVSDDWGATLLVLLASDLVAVGSLLLLGVSVGWPRSAWFRFLLVVLLFLGSAIVVIDSSLQVLLDTRFDPFDLWRFAAEPRMIVSFLGFRQLFLLAFLVGGLSLEIALSRRRAAGLCLLGGVGVVVGLAATSLVPGSLRKYTAPPLADLFSLRASLGSAESFRYSPEEIQRYRAETEGLSRVSLPREDVDIILLIIESMSAVDSARISGIRNRLAVCDDLSERGILFTNFFANHIASEGGIVSLLSGVPPLHFPTASPLLFREFARQESVVAELRGRGYSTEFLTTADMAFLDLHVYLEAVGFDVFRGRDEVPEFAAAPQIVEYSPSDDYLYREALERVDDLTLDRRPFLLVLATASSHLPHTHPHGGEDSGVEVWRWVCEQITGFAEDLAARGFFDDGILLVTGDHRSMEPVLPEERRRYAQSAKARVPLLIMGAGIPEGRVDDRFFQQADLFAKLSRALESSAPLSPNPIWVERYTAAWGRISNAGRFTVFDEAEGGRRGFEAYARGRTLAWRQDGPPGHAALERRIHAQRAIHQDTRNRGREGCPSTHDDDAIAASDQPGLRMEVFRGSGMDGRLDPGSERFLASRVVESIDFGFSRDFDPGPTREFVAELSGYLEIERAGGYWFRVKSDGASCLRLDGQLVVDHGLGWRPRQEMLVELLPGLYRVHVRSSHRGPRAGLRLEWLLPGRRHWEWASVPPDRFRLEGRE